VESLAVWNLTLEETNTTGAGRAEEAGQEDLASWWDSPGEGDLLPSPDSLDWGEEPPSAPGPGPPAILSPWPHAPPRPRHQAFPGEPGTAALVISLVLGVAGFTILILLLSMVFITLSEDKEREELVVEGAEDEGPGPVPGLVTALRGLARALGRSLAGARARLLERDYIQVI
jgi:hypothetical protein